MISDKPLIVVFRNFYRNKMVNLSALSVRHFLPNAEVYCYSFYKHDISEYDNQEPLLPFITEFVGKTKYISKNLCQDNINPSKTSGYANDDNGAYFTEGYNRIFEQFKYVSVPVLMLAEDHFFQLGTTLKELVDTDWDVAYADAESEKAGYFRGNGSILGIVPTKVTHLFPITEYLSTTVEWIIGNCLLRQIDSNRLHRISTRKWLDYCGDGIYTNSSEVIKEEMIKAGIL